MKPIRNGCLVLFVHVFICGPAAAQCLEYGNYLHLEGRIATPTVPVLTAARAGYVYVTNEDANSLQVVDATDPANPVTVKTLPVSASIRGLDVQGGFVYVLNGYVEIVDVSIPSVASVVGRWAIPATSLIFPDTPLGIDVGAGYAYVTTTHYSTETGRHYNLWIVDVSDPTAPAMVGSLEVGAGAYSPVYAAGFVYVAGQGDDTISTIDVSNPAAPVVVDILTMPGSVWYLCAGTGYLYAAEFIGEQLHVVDLAAPSSPVLVKSLDMGGRGKSMCYDDGHVYLTHGLQWASDYVVYDVTTPAEPVLAAQFYTGAWSNHISAADGWAYAADDDGVQIVGPVPYFAPVVGRGVSDYQFMRGVEVSGEYAYAAGSYYEIGLMVWDVSDPTIPVLVAETPGPDLMELHVDGSYVYGAGYGGLRIFDVSDPKMPVETGDCYFPDACYDVALSGGYAYLTAGRSNLQVFDVSDTAAPAHLDSLSLPDQPRGVDVAGQFAYLACTDAGLVVVDISAPAAPVVVGAVDTPGIAYRVLVRDAVAYLADYQEGLQVIDVSDPANPAIISSLALPGYAMDLDDVADHIYVAAHFGGLQVIDVSDPMNPTLIGTMSTADVALGIDATEDHVYLADRLEGLAIGRLQCGGASAVSDEDGPDTGVAPGSFPGALAVAPNPFNPQTMISFRLAQPEWIRIEVYDLAGRRVAQLADGPFSAGDHQVLWNGRDSRGRQVSSGTYLVRRDSESAVEVRKVAMVR